MYTNVLGLERTIRIPHLQRRALPQRHALPECDISICSFILS